MSTKQYYDDPHDDSNDLDDDPIEQQKEEDLIVAMAKQGLNDDDFLEVMPTPVGAFIDERVYK